MKNKTAIDYILSYLPQIDYGFDPYYIEIVKDAKFIEKDIKEKYAIDFVKFFWTLHTNGKFDNLKFEEILEIYKEGLYYENNR